jgi:integrase
MALNKRGNVYHYDFSLGGQRYRGSTGETALVRAEMKEKLKFSEANQRGGFLVPRRPPVLIDFIPDFLQWVEASQLEPKTKLYYRNGLRQIRATPLIAMRLDRITTDEAEAVRFTGSAQNGNRGLRTLRRLLGKAAERGLIRMAPKIKLLKEYGRLTIMEHETEAKLLAVASQPLKDVLVTILDTGMRPHEVFRMRWEHLNWENRAIFVPFGKTRNARRYVPISQRLMTALMARCAGQRDGWVFLSNSRSGHLTTVAKAFAAARRKAGVGRDIVLYSARHTFATRVLAATGNLAVLMRAMGNASPQTAMIYQHPGLEAVRQAIDQGNLEGSGMSQSRHNPVLLQ